MVVLCLYVERESKGEDAALANRASPFDAPTKRLHDPFRHGKAQPQPTNPAPPDIFRAKERVEHFPQIRLRDPYPFVGDCEDCSLGVVLKVNPDGRTGHAV